MSNRRKPPALQRTSKRTESAELANGLDPATNDSIDSDGDGWADWKERLAGTNPNASSSTPNNGDGFAKIFDVTFSLNSPDNANFVVKVGTHSMILSATTPSITLTLLEGVAHDVTLFTANSCTASLSASINSTYAVFRHPHAAFTGTANLPGKWAVAAGQIMQPVLGIDPKIICFHSTADKSVRALSTPDVPGTYYWRTVEHPDESTGKDITLSYADQDTWIMFGFMPEGATSARRHYWEVNHCTLLDEHPDWLDPENDEPPYRDIEEPEGESTSGESRFTGTGYRTDILVSVNNDDDDASESADTADNSMSVSDDDLVGYYPLGYFNGRCCSCLEHRAKYADSATLVSASSRLSLYTDTGKTNAFNGTIHAAEALYVEGLSKSPAVGTEKLVWQYTDTDNETHEITNVFTVLSQRIFGDLDFDGSIGTDDKAAHSSLSPEFGWIMPAVSGLTRKMLLRTDVNIPGLYSLSLSGDNAFRVYSSESTNGTPLLVGGQIITNGMNSVSFLSGSDTTIYVEAFTNGISTLTYSFIGTGSASGIVCRATMRMTGIGVNLGLMWETTNKVNQIFNPTRKDDATGNTEVMEVVDDESYAVPRNNLYVVGDPDDGKYRISLDLKIHPVGLRNHFVCAAYAEAEKVDGSDAPVLTGNDVPVEMVIPGPGDEQTVTYEICVGFDVDGNKTLDGNEPVWPLEVYRRQSDNSSRYATLRGISKEMYDEHYSDIYGFVHFLGQSTPSLVVPNARSFLALFLTNGDMESVEQNMQPIPTNSVPFNAFADGAGFAEWLTHNSGATFNDDGVATLSHYLWDEESPVSQFMANRTPFALKTYMAGTQYIEFPTETGTRLLNFYNASIKDAAEAVLASATNNATVVFPQDGGWYAMPREGATNLFASLSPQTSDNWVVPSTQLVGASDDYGGWYALAANFFTGTPTFDDFDAFATVGRGRIINPKYRFTIQKQYSWLSGTRYVVTSVDFECDIEDLYDFNYEDGAKSAAAAALQLGFGRGTGTSPDRNGRGKIYRHTIQIRKTYEDPFTYNSY